MCVLVCHYTRPHSHVNTAFGSVLHGQKGFLKGGDDARLTQPHTCLSTYISVKRQSSSVAVYLTNKIREGEQEPQKIQKKGHFTSDMWRYLRRLEQNGSYLPNSDDFSEF